MRLDVFLADRLEGLTRSKASSLIRSGFVLVRGKPRKPSYRAEIGSRVLIQLPLEESTSVLPESIEFVLIREDESIAVIEKPAGLIVHCTPRILSGTLVNGLLARIGDLSSLGGPMRRGIVHLSLIHI